MIFPERLSERIVEQIEVAPMPEILQKIGEVKSTPWKKPSMWFQTAQKTKDVPQARSSDTAMDTPVVH